MKLPKLTAFEELTTWLEHLEEQCNVVLYKHWCQEKLIAGMRMACKALVSAGKLDVLEKIAFACNLEEVEGTHIEEEFALGRFDDCGHPFACVDETDDSCLWC